MQRRTTTTSYGVVCWDVAPGAVDELFGRDGLLKQEWERGEHVEVVKTGRHRTVYRLRSTSQRYYLKHYRISDRRALLQNLVRPAKAMVEWNTVRRVAATGIPTFEALAFGRVMSGLIVRDSFLVSRSIEDTEPLDDFVAGRLNTFPPKRRAVLRQSLSVELGRLSAGLMRHGLMHHDFHAGNILVRIEPGDAVRLWLVDLHAVSFHRQLTLRHMTRTVSQLNVFFTQYATSADRLRFFRTYWDECRQPSVYGAGRPERTATGSFHESAARFAMTCEKDAVRSQCRRDRSWARGNRRLIIADTGQTRCRGIAALGRSLITEIRDDPERLFDKANLQSGCRSAGQRRIATVQLGLNGRAVVCVAEAVERSRQGGLTRIFDRFSTVRRLWETGHAFLRRGIGTAEPLLFVETTIGATSRQYLLTEQLPDSVPLSQYLQKSRECRLSKIISQLAQQLRLMHQGRFDHPALSADNVFVAVDHDAGEHSRPQLWFCDLEHVRQRRRLSRRNVVQALAQLNGSLLAAELIRNTHRLRFLKRYLAEKFPKHWKSMWREIDRRTEKESAVVGLPPLEAQQLDLAADIMRRKTA